MENFSAILKKLDSLLTLLEKFILVFLFSLMILLSFLQVILREFFSTGFLWGDTLLRHGVLWIGFMGAAIATSGDKHFAIDILKKSFSPKGRIIVETITDFFASFILVLLSSSAVKFLKDDYASQSILFAVGNLEVPSYWLNLILPLGFIIITVHFLLRTVENLLKIFSTDNP
jgi:TRAP-type C4-dicarboxylate transport system permease small subunit